MDINSKLGKKIWTGTWMTLPLYPWSSEKNITPAAGNIFKEMQECNVTFKELYEAIKKWIKFRNEVFGRNCDNTEVYLMRENKRFGFFLHPNSSEFSLYNDFSEHLGCFEININDIPNDDFIEWIENITYEYINGIVHCSDCNKAMKKEEIVGRFFAGIYCKECWEREWKERETRENYD